MKTIQKLRLAENDPSLSPGPWRIVRPAGDFPQVWRAENTALGSRNNWAVCTGIQSEADLRLISLAPEMAEALRECITEDGALAWRGGKFAGQRLEAISNLVRAVLAKVEGREG